MQAGQLWGVILDYWITEKQLAVPALAAIAVGQFCKTVTFYSLGHD